MRPLADVLDGRKRILPYGDDHALAVALGFPDSIYAVKDGKIIELPVEKRTDKRVYFGGGFVKRDQLEGCGAASCFGGGWKDPGYVYATRGLAEALLGEWLPPLPPPPVDPQEGARRTREVLRHNYRHVHDAVDTLAGCGWGLGVAYITDAEATRLHADIDARCKADGLWDDDLPERWWQP